MRTLVYLFLFFACTIFPYCSVSKKAAVSVEKISYQRDIAPIMLDRCTPCHYPEQGKKKFLDTYQATADNIDDILTRIQLPQDNKEFMPFKSKKPPLSDSLVQVFVRWKAEGMGR